jgi:hypothetical protein
MYKYVYAYICTSLRIPLISHPIAKSLFTDLISPSDAESSIASILLKCRSIDQIMIKSMVVLQLVISIMFTVHIQRILTIHPLRYPDYHIVHAIKFDRITISTLYDDRLSKQ